MKFFEDIITLPFNNSRHSYEEIMNKILDSTNISDDNKKYIKSLDETKEKWSLTWRKEEFIIGIQTTSRMESLHAMVKKFIR